MCGVRVASLVAQMVKRLPAMGETWVRFLGWEDPLEKGMATHSSGNPFSPGESQGQRSWQATVHGIARTGHDLVTKPSPPPYPSECRVPKNSKER